MRFFLHRFDSFLLISFYTKGLLPAESPKIERPGIHDKLIYLCIDCFTIISHITKFTFLILLPVPLFSTRKHITENAPDWKTQPIRSESPDLLVCLHFTWACEIWFSQTRAVMISSSKIKSVDFYRSESDPFSSHIHSRLLSINQQEFFLKFF